MAEIKVPINGYELFTINMKLRQIQITRHNKLYKFVSLSLKVFNINTHRTNIVNVCLQIRQQFAAVNIAREYMALTMCGGCYLPQISLKYLFGSKFKISMSHFLGEHNFNILSLNNNNSKFFNLRKKFIFKYYFLSQNSI